MSSCWWCKRWAFWHSLLHVGLDIRTEKKGGGSLLVIQVLPRQKLPAGWQSKGSLPPFLTPCLISPLRSCILAQPHLNLLDIVCRCSCTTLAEPSSGDRDWMDRKVYIVDINSLQKKGFLLHSIEKRQTKQNIPKETSKQKVEINGYLTFLFS